MAVIRCPNCGKPNPDFLPACQYCDKPLAGATPVAPETPAPDSAPREPASDLPDWLRQSTGPLDASGVSGAPAAEPEDVPEWLRGTVPLAEPSTGDVPDWLKEATGPLPSDVPVPPAAPGDVPDWLQGATSPLGSQPSGDVPDWLKESTGPLSPPEADVPDWLKSLGATSSLPDEPSSPPPATPIQSSSFSGAVEEPMDTPDWLKDQTGTLTPAASEVPDWLKSLGSGAAASDTPDWLRDATGPLSSEPPTPTMPKTSAGTAPFTAPLDDAGDVPDWLKDATGPLSEPPRPRGTAPFSMPIDAEPEATPESPPIADETPDWLKSLGAEAAPAESGAGARPELTPSAEPDWMRDVAAPTAAAASVAAAASEEPDWLASLRQEARLEAGRSAEPSLPATSPFGVSLTPDEQPAAPVSPSGAEPDWLAALRAAPPSEPDSPTGPPLELAQGELPTWLSAMRPVDVQPTEVEREVDEYQETVGVLTGMKGVLRAEPSVVLPGKSAAQVHVLRVDAAQKTQAAMLAAMLAEDRAGAPAAKRAARKWPWERWVVSLALLLGVLIPAAILKSPPDSILYGQVFPLPKTAPAEVRDTHDFLNGLPTDKPVLVAFDYEPAHSGELRPVAEAVLSHLMRRGSRFAAVSTSLAGAGEGDAVLDKLANDPFIRGNAPNTYRYGETHLNLGYLPGGPVGILQFSLSPQSVLRTDFHDNAFADDGGLWAQPPLAGVGVLDDFGAVIVFSATPEGARAWVEQTAGHAAPLVLVVSGGTGPMVRPYYEADPTRIRGFMSGPLTALQYNVRAQANISDAAYDETLLRWQMLGGGLWASALLLLFGILAYGLAMMIRWQRVKA
ncbi:MAG: hypothetical protein ACT4QE_06885 [Anaerolineales bacterium]